jgi:transposase-like protein
MIGRSWRNNWARVIPFFQFPEEIRRVIYTRKMDDDDQGMEASAATIRDRVRRRNAVTLNHQQAIYTEKLRPSKNHSFQ